MRGEGKEEGSDTFKALKTGCFTVYVSSSFLYSSDSFSGEKKGELAGLFICGEREGRRGKRKRVADREIYTILDAVEALYGDDSTSLRGISIYRYISGIWAE